MDLGPALEPFLIVVDVLERLGVDYLVGGSVASSVHGTPRSTLDVDVVAALRQPHVGAFVAALEGQFHLDEKRSGGRSPRNAPSI